MSVGIKEKEQIEEMHFNAFRELLFDFPDGQMRRGNPPAPDFLIDTNHGTLGVELTSISGSRREVEEFHNLTIQEGQEEYQRRGGPNAIVSFFWEPNKFPRGMKAKDLGRRLADLVERLAPTAADGPCELEWLELKNVGLEKLFSKIRIKLFPDIPTHWSSPDAGFLSSEIEIVQKIVTQKEEKLPKYRLTCKEVWLLLIAEGVSISRSVDIEKLSREVLKSSFDRIYLLDFFGSNSYKSHPDPERKFVHQMQLRSDG